MNVQDVNTRGIVDGHADRAIGRVRRYSKAVIWSLIALALLVAGGVYGVHWWTVGRFIETTDDAYVRADVVTMSPKVAGYVIEVDVQDNEPVKAGDVLLRIDDRDYRAKVDHARAAVEAAKATIEADQAAIANIDARIAQQRSVIAQAEASARSAEAEQRRSTLDYRRYQSLVGQQVASRQRMEAANAAYQKANAANARAHAAVAAQKGIVPVLDTQRREAEAKLDQSQAALKGAEAALQLAQIDLEHTVIRAPTDGVVGQRMVRVGQFLEPGQPILAVVPLRNAYIVANYKETQVGHMRLGQPVAIKVDAYSDTKLQGRLASFSPASGSQFALLPPDNATGNFTKIVQRIPVKILLPRDNPLMGRLRPGMSVIASVDTRAQPEPARTAFAPGAGPDDR